MKLADLIPVYLNASPEVGGNQRATLLRIQREKLAQCMADRLKPKDIIDHMKLRNRTVSAATAAHDIVYMRGMLDYAQVGLGLEGINSQAIAEAMPVLRRQRLIASSETRTRVPTQDEINRILADMRRTDPRSLTAEIVEFQAESGRRISETCRLQWGDLDAAKKTILVRDLKHPRKKTGHHKRAALPDAAFAIIQRQERMTTAPDERIFKALSKTVQKAFRRAAQACGIEGLHLHDLRAGIVTRLLDAGYTESQATLVTLHDNTRILRTRYNRLQAEDFPRRAA